MKVLHFILLLVKQMTQIKQHVILIEDNIDDAEAFKMHWEPFSASYPITWYSDSEKALEMLSNTSITTNKPILFIVDLNMPKIGGIEIVKSIRSNEALILTPVIVYSTSLHLEDRKESFRAGANSYMQKPICPDRFKKICNVIKEYWIDCSRFSE